MTAWLVALLAAVWGGIIGWALTLSVSRFVNPTPGKRRRS